MIRGSLRLWFAVLVAQGGTHAPMPGTARQAPIMVRMGVTVRPDTVRVGDPFLVTVGIRAPAGATITLPNAPDSTSTVQALDPRRLQQGTSTAAVEVWAYYRVAAWDVGVQPIRFADAVVTVGGVERKVPLGGHAVFVRSVLPADTAQRVPKAARDLYEFGWPLWWYIVAALVALGIISLLVWWWRRRRRRQPLAALVDPYERAEQEFVRIEALGLIEAGERSRYVALVVEVLRDYLAARYDDARLSLTSTELSFALRGRRAVPLDRLARTLDEADLVKFARLPVSAQRARELGREARAMVAAEHEASMPVSQVAA